jgi:hypothetical protein
MVSFLKKSNIKFTKVLIHSIILTIILSLLSNVCTDILALIFGHPIENNLNYVTYTVLIWLFFALQSEKYKKR